MVVKDTQSEVDGSEAASQLSEGISIHLYDNSSSSSSLFQLIHAIDHITANKESTTSSEHCGTMAAQAQQVSPSPTTTTATTIALSHIKNDFYEAQAGTVSWIVYVRQMESVCVEYDYNCDGGNNEQLVRITFSTRDASFLSQQQIQQQQQEQQQQQLRFEWTVQLFDQVVSDECSFRLNRVNLELKLKKRNPSVKWTTVLAVATTNNNKLPQSPTTTTTTTPNKTNLLSSPLGGGGAGDDSSLSPTSTSSTSSSSSTSLKSRSCSSSPERHHHHQQQPATTTPPLTSSQAVPAPPPPPPPLPQPQPQKIKPKQQQSQSQSPVVPISGVGLGQLGQHVLHERVHSVLGPLHRPARLLPTV